jgi:hypothetical protein
MGSRTRRPFNNNNKNSEDENWTVIIMKGLKASCDFPNKVTTKVGSLVVERQYD